MDKNPDIPRYPPPWEATGKAMPKICSPLQRIGLLHCLLYKIETIRPYAISPWERRMEVLVKSDHKEAAQVARAALGIVVATFSSEKSGIVGMGGVICDTTTTESSDTACTATFSATLGPRDRLNTYFAEIIAIATALRNLSALPL